MITELAPDAFQKMLEDLYRQNSPSDPAQKNKEKAWQILQGLGMPTRKSEVFQYIRLRTLYGQTFESSRSLQITPQDVAPHILPECSESVVVMINGHYRPDLSRLSALPKRLIILPLQEAFRTYGSFLNNQWNRLLKEEKDPFAILNAALYHDGLFIYAPPKTILEVPLQILQITACDDCSLLTAPRLQSFIGSQSQVDFIFTQAHVAGQKLLSIASMDVVIDEDAHVRCFQTPLNLTSQGWYFDAFRANLKRNSTLKTVLATNGSTSLRHDYRIALIGENAEASLNGIWMLSQNNEAHAHVLMDHQVPHCRSMQFFKGALNDTSRSSFEGKILVQQAAQKTEAFQLNNNLLLSDKAQADSKPNLEIFADDVKASHGATMGQLDREQLFYLKTRGYSEQAAKNLLVFGFCKEVLDLIPFPSLKNIMQNRAKSYLEQGL